MTERLDQFVPSAVCLGCDGCCRFKEPDSVWRPFMSGEERAAAAALPLFDRMMKDAPEGDDRLPVKNCGGEHGCVFFHSNDHTCGIYSARPFECRLYPFILSRHEGGVKLFVHLSCPYVQEQRYTEEFSRYTDYLLKFLRDSSAREFVQSNPDLAGDYGDYHNELEYVFTLEEA